MELSSVAAAPTCMDRYLHCPPQRRDLDHGTKSPPIPRLTRVSVEILLHLPHQIARKGLELLVFHAVLGSDDKPELMPVAFCTVEEALALRPVVIGIVKFAPLSLAAYGFPLDIPEVRCRISLPLPGKLNDPSLNGDAAPPHQGELIPMRKTCT